ncbi:MAG: zinc ribbon domain-containing protein [Candidatus Thermoplasmatota archaeon]
MTNHCSECGAELRDDAKYCLQCGKKVEEQPVNPMPPEPQKQEEQPKATEQPKPKKKPNKKMLLGILAVIIAVVIIAIVLVYLLDGTSPLGGADSRFVGEWERNTQAGVVLWKFNSNSTLEEDTTNKGTWMVQDTQICLYNNTQCYTYEFSNNGNTVTLTKAGTSDIILTKKGQQGTPETPDIECTTDSALNRVVIRSIDANVKWSDIAITTTPPASWQVQDSNYNGLARIGTTTTISAYVSVGDNIFVWDVPGDITVTLTYLPTSELLGNWTVNV